MCPNSIQDFFSENKANSKGEVAIDEDEWAEAFGVEKKPVKPPQEGKVNVTNGHSDKKEEEKK